MILKKSNKFGQLLITVLLFPLVLVFLFCILIITPFDYFRYKKSRYYKDTKEKYSWLCGMSSYVKLYCLIKKENLPINYYRYDEVHITGYGFFIYKDTLILNDYELCYDEEKNIWLFENEDEYVDIKEGVEYTINECNEFLKNDVCKKAVVLIDRELYEEHPDVKYENIDFLPISNDLDAEAIRTLIV